MRHCIGISVSLHDNMPAMRRKLYVLDGYWSVTIMLQGIGFQSVAAMMPRIMSGPVTLMLR